MKSIATIFGYLWRGLDSLRKVLHLLVLLILLMLVVAVMSPRIPIVPQSAALVVAPHGALVEQLTGDPLERAVAEASGRGTAETLVRDVVDAINAGSKDERIKLMVLDLGSMYGGSIVKMQEVAESIENFRKAGKKVIAFGEGYDQSQYYLASHADEIYLDPQGMVLIEGFGYFRTFLKGFIDKFDVDVNIFRAGKFKSFTDQYSRSDMSEQEREESSAWLNALWTQYQASVTQARGIDGGAIDSYVNELAAAGKAQAGNLAAVALDRGLITEIKSRREVENNIQELVGENEEDRTYNSITHWDYIAAVRATHALDLDRERLGVVVASGDIMDGDFPPGTVGSESAVRLLRQARYDDKIKAIVLRIDSPGGSMMASEVIRQEIDALRAAGKPVVASMSSLAASGGYYIAMDADEIWASPATLTGSIGVFAVFPTFERTLKKIGVTTDGIGTTPLAGQFDLGRTLHEQPREILQLSVDHAYGTFIGHVAAARKKSVAEIDAVAQGRVWAGSDAAKIGLVDKLGTYRDALDAAAKRAGLKEGYHIEYIEPSLGWRQALARQTHVLANRISQTLLSKDSLLSTMQRVLSPIETELATLAKFSDSTKVYYYCACPKN